MTAPLTPERRRELLAWAEACRPEPWLHISRPDLEALLASAAEVDQIRAQVAAVEALCASMEERERGLSGFLHVAARTVPSATARTIRAALAAGDEVTE